MTIQVLVADDSPTIRRRAAATLEEAGYDVTCVDDGQAAWDWLQGHVPGAVLCDILMPQVDGYEVCRRAKADGRLARVPVLLLRGTFEPWDQAKAESVGADGFVTKPFEADALLLTLHEVLQPAGGHEPAAPVAEAQAALAEADPFGEPEPVLARPAPAPEPDPAEADPFAMDGPAPTPPPAAPVAPAAAADPFSMGDDEPLLQGSAPAELAPPPVMATAPSPPPPPAPVAPSVPSHSGTGAAGGAGAAGAGGAGGAGALAAAGLELDEALLDRLAERIVKRLTQDHVERIAWEVVPDVAEAMVRQRLLDLERQLANE